MKSNYNKKFICLLIIVLISINLHSQRVETVRLEVEKEIPGESFSDNKFEVDFWVQVENFSAVDPKNTELLELKDDTGKDLIKTHESAVQAYKEESERLAKKGHYRFSTSTEALIKPDQWEKMYDTIGFMASIKSLMIMPSPKASKVRIKMKVGYTQAAGDGEKSTTITTQSLANESTVELLGVQVPLVDNGTMTHNDNKYIFYSFPKSKTPVAITRIEPVSQEFKTALEETKINNKANEFFVKEGDNAKPITIKVHYKELEKKSLIIDKWVSLGL